MSDLPTAVHINEEGPREGFQIEKGAIPTARKIALIDALSQTGIDHIQIVSFVNPKNVPGMADADDGRGRHHAAAGRRLYRVVAQRKGLSARAATHEPPHQYRHDPALRLGEISRSAIRTAPPRSSSPASTPSSRCTRRPALPSSAAASWRRSAAISKAIFRSRASSRWCSKSSMWRRSTASRCSYVTLADTMAWATPLAIKRVVGALRERWPDLDIALHLHDTRGMAIANAYAGLEMGVTRFDAAVAGLGGCPFAGHHGAAGNVCTEDLVFHVRRNGHQDRHRSRCADRMRASLPKMSSAIRCPAR